VMDRSSSMVNAENKTYVKYDGEYVNGTTYYGYHNNSYTYYDRHITHPAMGLNWYGCGGCKTVDSHAPEYDISTSLSPGWPRSDTELFQCTVSRYILPGIEKNSPFFTYYLTVSGHSNYSFTGNCISRKNRQYVESSHASNTVKAYLSAQKELDFALEFLLNELKENDNLEETVIVIANDHHPYGLAPTWAGNDNTDYLSELYGKKAISLADKEKGVFIIYNTKQTPENVTVPVCSFDVMPTLLNMFGIEFDSRLLCGKDAFTPGERLIPFSDGSFVSEKGYFNPRTHNIGDQNYVDEIKNKILLQKRYSLSARKNGYFSYLSR